MIEQYLNMDKKKFSYFLGLVTGAIIFVTMIYWVIFGFDRWNVEIQRASDLMMAAAVAPAYNTPAGTGGAGQYVCPQDGVTGLPNFDAAGLPHCPVCGLTMEFHSSPQGSMALAAAPG